ncbi:MAG: alcohol dehydrogenase catalytic domain-containing protein, partial [Gaiella sp.]
MKTRAALFHAVGEPFEVAELDVADPGPHDVVVRMHAVGICGTDLHQVKGEFQRPTPMVLGHEGAGVVEEVGVDVVSVQPGDHVVLSWAPGCGSCVGCRRGRPATCRTLNAAIANGTLPDGSTGLSLRGETVYRGTATGCLAEHCVVSETAVLPLGADLPLEQAALLGCAALTGVGAVLYAAALEPGARVLVLGAGGV